MAGSAETSSDQLQPRRSLELSGAKLRAAVEALIKASDTVGGVERFASFIRTKSEVFQERLANDAVERLERNRFEEIVPLMATVRCRIGKPLDNMGWPALRSAMAALLDGAKVPGTGDARIAAFCRCFPEGRDGRFARDLASELLHNVYPEHYPLMMRWVWDVRVNTGVLREIWHGENVDHLVIDVPDDLETFILLREELSQFLSSNGIFRDVLWYVDLLSAQIYGDYINSQGGAYLKADFGETAAPLEQSWRILGLDRIGKSSGSSAVIDGSTLASKLIGRVN